MKETLNFCYIFQTHSSSSILIKLDIFQHVLECSLDDFNPFLKKTFFIYKDQNLPNNLNHDDFLNTIKNFVINTKFHENFTVLDHANTLSAFFYLLCGILISNGYYELENGFRVSMKSGITTGAGLGSSASYAVCLAGSFYFFVK